MTLESQTITLDLLDKGLTGLTEREQEVFVGRVLFNVTLDEMGTDLGVTRETVRQIYLKALRKLRQRLWFDHRIDVWTAREWEAIEAKRQQQRAEAEAKIAEEKRKAEERAEFERTHVWCRECFKWCDPPHDVCPTLLEFERRQSMIWCKRCGAWVDPPHDCPKVWCQDCQKLVDKPHNACPCRSPFGMQWDASAGRWFTHEQRHREEWLRLRDRQERERQIALEIMRRHGYKV